jgi:hypothetical protein
MVHMTETKGHWFGLVADQVATVSVAYRNYCTGNTVDLAVDLDSIRRTHSSDVERRTNDVLYG